MTRNILIPIIIFFLTSCSIFSRNSKEFFGLDGGVASKSDVKKAKEVCGWEMEMMIIYARLVVADTLRNGKVPVDSKKSPEEYEKESELRIVKLKQCMAERGFKPK